MAMAAASQTQTQTQTEHYTETRLIDYLTDRRYNKQYVLMHRCTLARCSRDTDVESVLHTLLKLIDANMQYAD